MVNTVAKRFYADTIPNQPEFALPAVPNPDCKHPPKLLDTRNSPLLERVQDDFSVRVIGLPMMSASSFELTANFRVIVDFSVENNPHRAIFVAHRLGGGFGKIDDGEPSMPETNAPVPGNPSARTVRSSMFHRIAHPIDQFFGDDEIRVLECKCPTDATHGVSFFSLAK